MNHPSVLLYRRIAVFVAAIGLAGLLVNWVKGLPKCPSDLEIEEQLLAIKEHDAASFAQQQAKELWYDKEVKGRIKPIDIKFEDIFSAPCLFAREDVRRSDTGRISSRRWAFVLLPLSSADRKLESNATIVVLTYADVLGFERGSDFYLPSTDYERELASLKRADFHSMQTVGDCKNQKLSQHK